MMRLKVTDRDMAVGMLYGMCAAIWAALLMAFIGWVVVR